MISLQLICQDVCESVKYPKNDEENDEVAVY